MTNGVLCYAGARFEQDGFIRMKEIAETMWRENPNANFDWVQFSDSDVEERLNARWVF